MTTDRDHHNAYQRQLFATEVGDFCQPIPRDVGIRLDTIVSAASLSAESRVLDVGTGVGVLLPRIKQYGVSKIVACDLSSEMLAEARRRHPDVAFWCGDMVDLPRSFGRYGAVFFNAMFGNVWDQGETLASACMHLAAGGRIIISHPMGAGYVDELRQADRMRVPHVLPKRADLLELTQQLPVRLLTYESSGRLYLAVLKGSADL